jgi:DNA excision repair protein ERCC-5
VNDRQIQAVNDDSLFVEADGNIGAQQQNNDTDDYFNGEDDDLKQAIALSLQPHIDHDEIVPEIAINRPAERALSHDVMMPDPDSESDDGMDFGAAVAKTKVTKKAPQSSNPFGGPLPFESIKLTKATKDTGKALEADENAGGFVKESTDKPKQADPLPPWFVGERSNQEFIVDPIEDPKEQEKLAAPDHLFLSNRRSPEVIDVDQMSNTKEVVDLEKDSDKKVDIEAKKPEPISDEEIEKLYRELPSMNDQNPSVEPTSVDTKDDEAPLESTNEQDQGRVPGPETKSPEISARVEHSPSPEFEDVVPPPLTQGPEITVVSREPQFQNQLFEEVEQPEIFGQDQGDYSDPEDEDLFKQLAAEGEEHARFTRTLNNAAPIQDAFDYEQELKQLRNQHKKDRRDADEVTTIMINECQQLLTLFGLPYITAPMEAEAQCAELVSLGLVDGIVTDDSDIFLFGGTKVYKNMFNQSKFVECYLSSDLEKEYALHRQKLISFAHLLGSDYTEGIPGIGPVTALEIITEFSNLEEFREWWSEVQMGTKKPDDVHLAFRKKFRKKASKIFLPPSFPDTRVDTAYLEPEVDSDPSQFQWGIPDLNGLRNFLMTTIGWSQERTDEVLVPVIRDMNRRDQEGTQSNITQFMTGPQGAGAFAPRVRSGGPSRMERAYGRLRQEAQGGQASSGDETPATGDNVEEASGSQTLAKRGASANQAKDGTGKKRKTRADSSAILDA